jgi:hypothetical protein
MLSNPWNSHPRLRALLLALALLLAPLLGLTATPALAAPSCATSGATVTCTFSYTGAAETWTAPAGVTQATFDLYGAQGSGIAYLSGGRGGQVTATLPVIPGATYQILVGDQFGFNGGGIGGRGTSQGGASGGGASDVRAGAFGLADRLLVAGGGGGSGGGYSAGGTDGIHGGDGGYPSGGAGQFGGGGGSQTAGGSGADGFVAGNAGSLGQGGNGGGSSDSGNGGGGGGGGYYGGGGGGSADVGEGGGGGGGSSYGPAGATFETGVRKGNGLVAISYTLPDAIAPIASPSQAPAANASGWNNTDVMVSWNWADNAGGVGIDAANCTSISSSGGEGAQTLIASCNDLAGNNGSASYSLKVDTTAPTISAAATTSPNANGWYRSDVTVAFSCADTLSGVASCPSSQTLSGEGAGISSTAQSVSDLAGNTSAPSNIVTVQIDRTAPSVSVTGVTNGATYSLGSVPTAACSTTDALSGVATQATLSISGGNADGTGSFTATCSGASDKAGNTGSASVSYTVGYRWSGFLQPIDNLPTVNTVKAGSAIPVTFSLGGNYGLSIFAAGYPKVQQVSCSSGAPTDEIEQTVTAGASSLSYDAASGQYSYTWKTDKAWANTCRQLTMRLVDGSEHVALFQFR